MPNEVVTKFRVDTAQAIRDIEAYKKTLVSLETTADKLKKTGVELNAAKAIREATLLEKLKREELRTQQEQFKLTKLQSTYDAQRYRESVALERVKKASLQTDKEQINYQKSLIQLEQQKLRYAQQVTRANRTPTTQAGVSGFTDSFTNRIFSGTLAGTTLGSIAGGIAGGVLIGGLTATANAVQTLSSEFVNLGVSSVKTAGNFELTANAMKVFTGSARLAKAELTDIADLARRTPGLGLQDAEKGALQFRGLGFDPKLAQDITSGLAKQKLLSGADESALQRVTVNITQLASGSPRVTQDIKEMIQSLPTLRLNLIDTFGSLEKFKQELARDPDGTLKKFAEGLANTKIAQAGLNDAILKGSDALLKASRAFGEPFLDPVTRDIKDLTAVIEDNITTIQKWGQNLSDLYRGSSNIVRNTATQAPNAGGLFGGGILEQLAFLPAQPIIPLLRGIQTGGAFSRIQEGLRQRPPDEAEAERKAREETEFRKQQLEEQRARNRELSTIESFYKERFSIIDSGLKLEEARLSAHGDLTFEQEKQKIASLSALRSSAIQTQIAEQTEFFNRQIALSTDEVDKAKLAADRDATIRGLSVDLQKTAFEAQKSFLELQKKIKAAKDEFRDFQSSAAETLTGNPFIGYFNNIEKAADSAFERFKVFGSGFANQAADIAAAVEKFKLQVAVYESADKALQFRQEAQRLRNLTFTERGGFERRFGAAQQGFGLLNQIAGFSSQADLANLLFRNPNADTQFFQVNSQLDNYDTIARRIEKLSGQFGDLGVFGRGAVAEAKLSALPSIDQLLPLAQQGDYLARNAISTIGGLNNVLAEASEARLQDLLQKQQNENLLLDQARERLSLLDRSRGAFGQNQIAYQDAALAILNQIPNAELNAQDLQRKIDLLTARSEAEENLRNIQTEVFRTIKGMLEGAGIKVDLDGQATATVEIKGELKGDVRRGNPSSATPNDTAGAMELP